MLAHGGSWGIDETIVGVVLAAGAAVWGLRWLHRRLVHSNDDEPTEYDREPTAQNAQKPKP